MSRSTRPPTKDMYWFAHGGPENEKLQRNSILFDGEEEMHASHSPTWNSQLERRPSPDEQRTSHTVTDSSGPSSLERDDRLRMSDKRIAVEERRKQLWEAEQERNEAVLRKHMEREAALEAKRNASRSTIAFAFGSSIPRNVDTLQVNEGGDADIMSRSFTSGATHKGDDMMSRSMHASISLAPRGRRKNDLMPTVPYERTPAPTKAAMSSSSNRKRSVSMTRLDQLALPRKHYLEANKASSSASSANSSMHKDNVRSPTRPLSSASENSGGSGRVSSSVTRRVRSSPRKPRPVSIAGTLPEQRQISTAKPFEVKASPMKRMHTPSKQPTTPALSAVKNSTPKSAEKFKQSPRLSTPPKLSTPKLATPKSSAPKLATPKSTKQTDSKPAAAKQVSSPKTPTPKVKEKKLLPIKKKSDTNVSSPITGEMKSLPDDTEKVESLSSVNSEVSAENDKNNAKRIISEEEAKAALAEKRRLAREQAEKEAELERQRQEELRLAEEERLRQEEEDHRLMAEEQMRLLEEHRRQEEEKLRKAIEDQEQKEEEERAKRDEEMRMKAEQEKRAKEEAEKQRLELEEKLRKEEEERAERKKRLEKIMSRTRGKSNGTSPSGSVSGSDQLDSGENAQEGFSSGANSLDSNEAADIPSEQASVEDHKAEAGDSLEANPTYEIGSENESLNSNDLMMPASETASRENSMVIIPEKDAAVLSYVPPSEGKDVEASALDGGNNDDALEIHDDGQAVMMTSMMTGSVYGEEMFNANVHSEVSFGESQLQSHLESEEAIMDGMDLVPEFKEVQSNLDSNLPEVVENQQNLGEFDMPSDVTGVDAFSQEIMSDNFQTQLVLDPKDSSNTQLLPDDLNMDAAASEMFERSSLSDMKLPDPIYETSEDGSISSEKHQVFGMQEEFNYSRNQENISTLDDVFSQQVILPDPDSVPQGENPFEMNAFNAKQNPFSPEYSVQRSEVDFNELPAFDMNGAMNETGHNVFNQDYEMGVNNDSLSPTVIKAEVHQNEAALLNKNNFFEQENNENIPADSISDIPVSQAANEFTDNLGFSNHPAKWDAEKGFLVDSPSTFAKDSSEDIGDNPFLEKQFNKDSQFESFTVFDKEFSQTQGETDALESQEVSDVTLIKETEDGACIGIISSIDHDQISNSFSKPGLLNEHLKNNLESSTMTDSEDNSSLDSNLSQVMTVESNGKDHDETSKNGFSNGEKHNLFDLEDAYNDSPSKASVNNFHASEMFSNSHKFESSPSASEQMSELHGYVQVGGNGILSVDHPKNNIFETANAMEFGKVSPDPFLVKGGSNQNPFLLQDDQKQVLMAPDFLN